MKFRYLLRSLFSLILLGVMGATAFPLQAQDLLWERTARTDAAAAKPDWFGTGTERGIAFGTVGGQERLYVLSRNAGLSMRAIDPLTGADVTLPTPFDFTGVTGGTFAATDVEISDDGVVFTANLATGTAASPFRLYGWTAEGGTFNVNYVFEGSASTAGGQRLGDSFTVVGSWAAGTIEVWTPLTGTSIIYVHKTTDQGVNWTVETVTLTGTAATNPANATVYPLAAGRTSDFYVNGNGGNPKRYTSAGEFVVGSNLSTTGSHTGFRTYNDGTKQLAFTYQYRVSADNEALKAGLVSVYDVTDGANPVFVASTPRFASADGGNHINGDVALRVDNSGTYIVYGLGTDQGVMAFGTLPPPAPKPIVAAWETNGLPSTIVPSPFLATTTADNTVQAGFSRSASITPLALGNGFSASGFNVADFEAAVAENKYFETVIQASAGYQVSLSDLTFNVRRSGTGPNAFQWAYSTDGTTFTAIAEPISYITTETNGATFGPVVLGDITAIQNVVSSGSVTLRLYAWGASAPGGTFALGRLAGDDLVIRGEVAVDPDYVAPTPATAFIALASGLAEVPANTSAGTGSITANLTNDQLVVAGTFSGLTGNYTMSHIHAGIAGVNGGVVVALTATVDTDGKGGSYEAAANTFTLSTEQIAALSAGEYYVNIHSSEFGPGEIRGQLLSAPNVAPTASTITSPANEAAITVEGFAGTAFAPTWTASTDADDDRVVYVWELAADQAFSSVLLTVTAGANTTANLTFGGVDALLAANGVTVGNAITLFHRVYSTDGSNLTPSEALSVTLTRGEVFAAYNIAQARALENGTLGVVVEGTVTRAMGREARMQDETGAISTFATSGVFFDAMANGDVRSGDLIRVTGRKTAFNDLTQMDNITAVQVISRDNTLPAAQLVTLAEIRDNGDALESKLIRVEGMTINAAGDVTFSAGTGSGKTYRITDATITEEAIVDFRVPNVVNTNLVGVAIPTEPFTFEGVLGRFRTTFQLYAVDASDVIVPLSPLSGSYFIPQGTNDRGFASLADAFAHLNEVGAVGPVTFLIDGDLDEKAAALYINRPDVTEATSITVKPAPGKTPTVTVGGLNTAATESAGAGIVVYNTSWVTFDGSNGSEEGSLDMTVLYDDTAGANGIFSIIGASNNVTVQNMNIQYLNAQNTTIGIRVRRDNAATTVPVGLVFDNNLIGSMEKPMRDAVALFGTGSPLLRVEAEVTNNGIYASHRGITTFFVENNVYDSNAIVVTGGFLNQAWYAGIYLAGGNGVTYMTNNRIYMMGANFTSDGRYVAGAVINLNLGEILIANNMITTTDAFSNIGTSTVLNRYGVVFHREGGGEEYTIAHNSVYLNNYEGVTSRSAAVGFEANGTAYNGRNTSALIDIRNNIFVNEGRSATSYAIHWPNDNGAPASNWNNYFVRTTSDASVGFFNNTATKTLTAWRTASGRDANSVTRSVEFVSSVDLTLAGNSLGDNQLAAQFIEFIDTDINGFPRSETAPYMGAYESDVTLTDVEVGDVMPTEFSLRQNYPNPFNPSTRIEFSLPVESRVELQIYTITGQLVATLVNEARPAGFHTVTFDASTLASGVYMYRLVAGDFIQTQKMTLIK